MTPASLAQLVLLGAIWGGAHALTRYSVPYVGPVWLVELRIGMAAVMLSCVAWMTARPLRLARQWRQILVLGAINTALPFFLLTYAAKSLNASVLSVLNATAPVFGALVGALWLKQRLTLPVCAGLLLGVAGVAVLVAEDLAVAHIPSGWPVTAVLCTAFLYGLSSNYARLHAASLDHFNAAHGSLWVACLLMLPAVPAHRPPGPISAGHVAAALTLGIVCTGVAYLLYFKLIRDVGPMSALTVAYLIPVFGVLWGAAFLGEPVTAALLAGGTLVAAGIALATGMGPRALLRRACKRRG
jgi:drug/metabolite transporter (DMT)-like permease